MENNRGDNLDIDNDLIKQFELIDESIIDRTVEEVLDVETGEILLASEIFENEESIIHSIRKTLELAHKSEMYKLICPYCQQDVRISHKRVFSRNRTTYFFSHYPNSNDCPIKSENTKSLEEFLSTRKADACESAEHKELVKFIAACLETETSKTKGFYDIKTNTIFKDSMIYNGWRKPDVIATYGNKKVVFEIQRHHTFLSEMIERDSFYRMHKTYIIWIFSTFSPQKQRMVEKDMYYAHKRNVFVLDHNTYYEKEKETTFIKDNYKYSQDESIKKGELILRCYWQIPIIDEHNNIKIEWHHKLVSIDELTFDEEKHEVYYYNSDADFYHQSDPEKQKIIDLWEAEKEKRWQKIFDSIELRKKRKKEWEEKREEREAKLAEKQKTIKLLFKIRDGEINLEPFKDEFGNYGFTAFAPELFEKPMIVIKPKYSEVGLYTNGIAFVKMANWGAINITGKKIISFQYLSLRWIEDTQNIIAKNKNSYYGIIDIEEKTIAPFIYNEIQKFINGKAIARKNYKYGQIDEDGNVVIPFEYNGIRDFENGKLILKKIKENSNSYLYSIIDENGNLIIPLICQEIEYIDKLIVKAKINDKYGLVDMNNNKVMPFIYQKISNFENGIAEAMKNGLHGYIDIYGNEIALNKIEITNGIFKCEKFSLWGIEDIFGKNILPFEYSEIHHIIKGKVKVKQNGRYGYADINGTIVIPIIYDTIYDFVDGKAKAKKGRYYGYLKENGIELTPFIYQEIDDFIDGIAKVIRNNTEGHIDENGNEIIQNKVEIGEGIYKGEKFGFWGIVNIMGETIVSFEFPEMSNLENGKLKVKKDGKYGYIDLNGNVIIPIIYQSIDEFHNNMAKCKKNNLYGYIDTAGNEVIPFKYNRIRDFINGKSIVIKDTILLDKKKMKSNHKYGLIDKKGTECIPLIYDEIKPFFNGFAIAKKEDKYGIIDEAGNTKIPFINDSMNRINDEHFIVKQYGKSGVIDMNQKIIIPFEHEDIKRVFNNGMYVAGDNLNFGVVSITGHLVVPFQYDDIITMNAKYIGVKSNSINLIKSNNLIAQKVNCLITGIADFGVFLELSGIKGLLHINEINRADMHIGTFSKGDFIDVFVSDADEEKNRLSFSILPNNREAKNQSFEQKTIALN
jgi:hypothetical protein